MQLVINAFGAYFRKQGLVELVPLITYPTSLEQLSKNDTDHDDFIDINQRIKNPLFRGIRAIEERDPD